VKLAAPPLQVLVKVHHAVDCGGELYLLLHPAERMNPVSCEKLHVAMADPIKGISIG
jgi:hypothetical protein